MKFFIVCCLFANKLRGGLQTIHFPYYYNLMETFSNKWIIEIERKEKNKQTVDDPSPSRRLGKSNGAKLYIYVKHKIIIERYELDKCIRLTLLAVQWGWVILEMTFAAKQDSASKATKGPPIYIYNHRCSGFRSNHRSFIPTVLFRMVRNCRTTLITQLQR